MGRMTTHAKLRVRAGGDLVPSQALLWQRVLRLSRFSWATKKRANGVIAPFIRAGGASGGDGLRKFSSRRRRSLRVTDSPPPARIGAPQTHAVAN
jgi:hypothetical protein